MTTMTSTAAIEPSHSPPIPWVRPPFVNWLEYEHQLALQTSQPEAATDGRSSEASFRMNASAKEFTPMSAMSGTQRLRTSIELALAEDPYDVGAAMAPSTDWLEWAMNLAEKYPERTELVVEEYQKDLEANKHLLKCLSQETRDGHSGSRVYIHALNYSLQDAFTRCSLPLPPGMNLSRAIQSKRGGEALYVAQMQAWMGYQSRIFRVIEIITQSSSVSFNKSLDQSLPEIVPTFKRRPMTTQVIMLLTFQEPEHDQWPSTDYFQIQEENDSDDDDISLYNDFQRDCTSKPEPSDPFRYPEGVQFYQSGGYSYANKFDNMIVTLVDGKEYWTEAMPDIVLRASEGNLHAVRMIIEAAQGVSDHEKRATVNKARKWLKWTFFRGQRRMPNVEVLYDGTPLIYAYYSGHHEVVEYLLEQGADPTLRGTIPENLSVNARGALHKLYGNIERGEVPSQYVALMSTTDVYMQCPL